MSKLRKYQGIWNAIRDAQKDNIKRGSKSSARIQVFCPPQNRGRIHKAVIKEKYIDDWPEKYFFKLNAEYNDKGIIFWLTTYRVTQVISDQL